MSYKVRGPDSADGVRCMMMDRLDDISPDILEKEMPFSVWAPCASLAFGEVAAFCPTKFWADRIEKALVLLDRVEKGKIDT